MQRVGQVTLPAAFSSTSSLYALISAISNYIPTNGILPDRCSGLKLVALAANTGTVSLFDPVTTTLSTGALTTASTLGVVYDKQYTRNCIDLKAIFPVGSAASQVLAFIIDFD